MTPKAMLTGRAAGTVMATKSRKETNTSSKESVFSSCGSIPRKVKNETKKRKKRNFPDYFWNMFCCSFGKRIILISWPLRVVKLVLVTQRGMPYDYRYF